MQDDNANAMQPKKKKVKMIVIRMADILISLSKHYAAKLWRKEVQVVAQQ